MVIPTVRAMEDSDDLRRFIAARLKELDLPATVCSMKIGMNRGYLHDYLQKGNPRTMPDYIKAKLARELRVAPTVLGLSGLIPASGQTPGFADDAVPYIAGPDDPIMPPHIVRYVMKTTALERHPERIREGTILDVNLNQSDPEHIPVGAIVVAQVFDRVEMLKSYGTVFRQFIPPDKLVTNAAGLNEIISLNDPASPYVVVIKGTVRAISHDLKSNGNRVDESVRRN